MMRLILIRHAESRGNLEGRFQGRSDFELSNLGRQQAERLFERFTTEKLSPTQVYSSPLSRAMETAGIVSRNWSPSIHPWPELVEYDVGVFEGLTWLDIIRSLPAIARDFEQSKDWDVVYKVELVKQRHERGLRVVESIIAEHLNDDLVVCFTHGGILQHIIGALLGTDRTWGFPVLNTAVFDFSLDRQNWSSQGNIRFNTHHWIISRFNDASHLDKNCT